MVFRLSPKRKPVTGYIYVPGGTADPRFLKASEGDEIRNPTREAPYIVVSHSTDDVLVTDWPGTLWRAEVVDALKPQGHTGDYTRAVAVRLIERVPTHTLFGSHGEGVAWVADRARDLTREEAALLAEARAPQAGQLYSKAWLNWDNLAADKRDYTEWEGIIGVGSEAPVSPVRRGLSAVFNCICARALETDGDDAWYTGDGPEEDPDMHLAEPWATASLALIEAAMALGAPDLLPVEDRAVLTAPWHRLTGPSLS